MLNISLGYEQERDIEAIFNLTQYAFEHAEHTDHIEQFIVNVLREAHE